MSGLITTLVKEADNQTPPVEQRCRADHTASGYHLPAAVSGPGGNQPLPKEPLGLKWHFDNPVVLLTGCCGGPYPASTACSPAVRGGTVLCPVPCLAQHCHLHLPPLLPPVRNHLSVVSTALHLRFGALGSSFLMPVSSLVLCTLRT